MKVESILITRKKAQIWSTDLVIASVIFIIGIVTAYLFIINFPGEAEESLDSLFYEGNLVATNILSEGVPLNWDSNPIGVVQPGILSNDRVDDSKQTQFAIMSTSQPDVLKRKLNTKFDFCFTVGGGFNPSAPPSGGDSSSSRGSFIVDTTFSINSSSSGSSVPTDGLTTPSAPSNGLILGYHLDNSSSLGENDKIIKDFSGSNYHGSVYKATWTSAGKSGGAFNFNGIDSYINSTINVPVGSTYSVSFWFYYKNSPITYSSLFRLGDSNGCIYEPSIMLYSNNVIDARVSGCSNAGLTGTAPVAKNQWNFVTYTVSSGSQVIYINGVAINSSSYTHNSGASRYIVLGAANTINNGVGNLAFFNGTIDEARIYNRVLSSSEVSQLYDSYNNDPTVMLYHLDNSSSLGENDAKIVDSSQSSFNGTVTNAKVNDSCKFGKCYSFDGSGDFIDVGNNILDSQSKGTITAWIKFPSIPVSGNQKTFFSTASTSSSGGNNLWSLGIFNGQSTGYTNARLRMGLNYPSINYIVGSTNLQPNTWYYVALTGDGSSWKFYVNGNPETITVETGSNTGKWWNVAVLGTMRYALGILHRYGGDLGDWYGSIDEFRIYNRVLSDAEIAQSYASYNSYSPSSSSSLKSLNYNFNNTNYNLYDDNLVLNMNFNNNAAMGEGSTKVVDSSKYSNNGTVTGATWTSSGKFGGAYQFNGVEGTKSISVPNSNSLNFGSNTNFSISVWVKPVGVSGDIIEKANGDGTIGYKLYMVNDVAGYARIRDVSGNDVYSTISLSPNKWNHIVAVFNRWGNLQTYVNGLLQDTDSIVSVRDITNTYPLVIGTGKQRSNDFNGAIDELRIYSKILSPAEINQLYMTTLQKLNQTAWNLYINQTKNSTAGLDDGTYTYRVDSTDTSGNTNLVEQKTVILGSGSQSSNPPTNPSGSPTNTAMICTNKTSPVPYPPENMIKVTRVTINHNTPSKFELYMWK